MSRGSNTTPTLAGIEQPLIVAYPLSDEEITALAHYLTHL